PVLAGWADLDQREDAADIGPGHPVLIDPEYRLDPVLARFLGRSRFAWLAAGTRQAYTKDYWLFFSFLWQRGRYWHEADPDDLLDWEAWRRRASGRAGGSAAASGSVSWRPCGWSTSGLRRSSASSAARSWSIRWGCAASR
ncbi:MAG TPA: hypothetical protein VFE59_29370, partial [Trebonia sp.]|nr:hypothetical protein [Trebonia sp.]